MHPSFGTAYSVRKELQRALNWMAFQRRERRRIAGGRQYLAPGLYLRTGKYWRRVGSRLPEHVERLSSHLRRIKGSRRQGAILGSLRSAGSMCFNALLVLRLPSSGAGFTAIGPTRESGAVLFDERRRLVGRVLPTAWGVESQWRVRQEWAAFVPAPVLIDRWSNGVVVEELVRGRTMYDVGHAEQAAIVSDLFAQYATLTAAKAAGNSSDLTSAAYGDDVQSVFPPIAAATLKSLSEHRAGDEWTLVPTPVDVVPRNVIVTSGGFKLIDVFPVAWVPFFHAPVSLAAAAPKRETATRDAYFAGEFDRELHTLFKKAGSGFTAEPEFRRLLLAVTVLVRALCFVDNSDVVSHKVDRGRLIASLRTQVKASGLNHDADWT